MAITYPLSLPTTIGIGEIELRANNVVGVSQSPFTYKQQVVQHQGQRWEASVSIPPVRKDLAEAWIAFLISLKGPVGTFYLGDPNMATPSGAATGSDTVTVSTSSYVGDETLPIVNSGGSCCYQFPTGGGLYSDWLGCYSNFAQGFDGHYFGV